MPRKRNWSWVAMVGDLVFVMASYKARTGESGLPRGFDDGFISERKHTASVFGHSAIDIAPSS